VSEGLSELKLSGFGYLGRYSQATEKQCFGNLRPRYKAASNLHEGENIKPCRLRLPLHPGSNPSLPRSIFRTSQFSAIKLFPFQILLLHYPIQPPARPQTHPTPSVQPSATPLPQPSSPLQSSQKPPKHPSSPSPAHHPPPPPQP
jgi:hypothetical protein